MRVRCLRLRLKRVSVYCSSVDVWELRCETRTGPSSGPGIQTLDLTKSLKFLLIDSIFLLSTCPDSPRHTRCFPSLFEDFFQRYKNLLAKHSPGLRRWGTEEVPHACPN
jgi:hypothetical protein